MVKKQGTFTLTVLPGRFKTSQITVMLGENGTGKTTFIKMLSECGKKKKEGEAKAPADETADKPASPEGKEKPAKPKKAADTNAPAKDSKPVSPESKKKADPKAPAPEAVPAASDKATNS